MPKNLPGHWRLSYPTIGGLVGKNDHLGPIYLTHLKLLWCPNCYIYYSNPVYGWLQRQIWLLYRNRCWSSWHSDQTEFLISKHLESVYRMTTGTLIKYIFQFMQKYKRKSLANIQLMTCWIIPIDELMINGTSLSQLQSWCLTQVVQENCPFLWTCHPDEEKLRTFGLEFMSLWDTRAVCYSILQIGCQITSEATLPTNIHLGTHLIKSVHETTLQMEEFELP